MQDKIRVHQACLFTGNYLWVFLQSQSVKLPFILPFTVKTVMCKIRTYR